jgi:DUF2946 family protein
MTCCRNPALRTAARLVGKHAVLDCVAIIQRKLPMSPFSFMRQRRPWLAAFALLAFTVRALIPVGFMPAGDGFFKLQLCPEGLSAQALALLDPHAAHHHLPAADGTAPAHDHQSWSSSHCPFGALANALPPSHPLAVAVAVEITTAPSLPEPVRVAAEHRFRIAQPRGPPLLV